MGRTVGRRSREPDDLKTTLYLPRSLSGQVKQRATEERMSVNALIIKALEQLLEGEGPTLEASAGLGSASVIRQRESGSAELRLPDSIVSAIADLKTRVEALEASRQPNQALTTPRLEPPRFIAAAEVREAVQNVIEDRGMPIPHRELLHILLYDLKLSLPGKDMSENLRTILVHPKAPKRFVFLKGHGYWLAGRPWAATSSVAFRRGSEPSI